MRPDYRLSGSTGIKTNTLTAEKINAPSEIEAKYHFWRETYSKGL